MAISAEEIKQIADAVAQRVVTPKELCNCGFNAWATAHLSEKIRESLEARDLSHIESDLDNFDNYIDNIARTCHVNLNAARDLVGKINKATTAESWAPAKIFLADAVIIIGSALGEVATVSKS